jgi:2-iminoacetate synthase
VAGDDPKVTTDYLGEIINRLRGTIPSVSLEIAPKSVDEYKKIREAGAEGVVIYQETYHQDSYERYHPKGSKSNYQFRLSTPERVATAGFHRVGMGVLLGLNNFIYEGLALFEHVSFILKHFWKTDVTISLPRIRKANQAIEAPFPVSDKEFTRLICSLRIAFPDVGILLSTREDSFLRDGLMKIGVTHISAGSKTEVGGYLMPDKQNEQFNVEDKRSACEVQNRIKEIGYEPVWKDWETALND